MDGDGTRRFTLPDPAARHALAAQDPRRYRLSPASANTCPVPQDATSPARHYQSSSLLIERSAQPTGHNVITTGSTVTGQSAPSLNSVTSGNDSIMSQFLKFFDPFVSLCMKQKEKEILQASIERQLKAEERVKTLSHHPAYKDLAQSIREGGSENLRRIDADIQTQEAICLELLPRAMDRMKSALHVAPLSLSNDAIAKLESDIMDKIETQLKAKMEAEDEAKEARLSKKIEASLRAKIEAEDEAKEARLAKKLEVEHEKKHAKLLEVMEARIRTAQLPTINPQETVEDVEVDPGTQKSNSMEWYKQKYRDHSPRLHELEVWKADELPKHLATLASSQDCKATQAKAEVAIQSVESLKSSMQSEVATVRSETTIKQSEILELIAGLDARLSALKSHEIAGLGKNLTNNIDNLQFQHGQILHNQNLRITKLETDTATMSTNLKTVTETQQSPGDHSAQIAKTLRHDLSALTEKFLGLQEGISNELGKHRNHVDARLQQDQVAIKHANDTAETLRVAIRSLENRYLNITTEDLFKNMVQAMKEMFPWMESQHQEIVALKEQLTSLADQSMTKTAFSKDIDVLKAEFAVLKVNVAQRIDALQVSTEDASPQASNGLVKDAQELWAKIENLKVAQTGQTIDIVKRVQEHAALRNQFETQSDTIEELAEKVSDLAETFENFNRLETTYERLKKDVTELQKRTENSQGVPGPKGFCSPDTVNMICETLITRHDKATTKPRFDQLIKMTSDLSQQWANFKAQEFSSLRLHEESFRPRTNGPRSEPQRENGTVLSLRLSQSARGSPGASQEPATTQNLENGSFEARPAPRSVSKTPPLTTIGLCEKSSQIVGKAPQKESDRHSKPSQDDSLGSRVAPSPLGADFARLSSPLKSLPIAKGIPQSALQRAKQNSKKRPRDSILLTAGLNGSSPGNASPGMDKASPTPSSSSDPSRKKKRRKEKHPSKRKKEARLE